jgi:hypothetical protein
MEMIGASQGGHGVMFARANYIRNVPYLMWCVIAAAVRAAGRPAGIGLNRPCVSAAVLCTSLYVEHWLACGSWSGKKPYENTYVAW